MTSRYAAERDAPAGSAALPDTPPNPGSDAARAAGCICAVLDNCHGKFAPYPPDGWYVTEGCTLHWPDSLKAVES